MKQKFYSLIGVLLLLSPCAISQFQPGKPVTPFFGQAGIKKKISELRLNAATNRAARQSMVPIVKPYKSYFKRYQDTRETDRPKIYGTIPIARDNNRQATTEKTASVTTAAGSTQEIWSNFLGIDFYENPIGWPPDPNGAVGESQVIVATNNGIKVFEKSRVTDAPLVTPVGYSRIMPEAELFMPLDDFFSPVLPKRSSLSDPHIRYDRLTRRWFIVAIEVNPTLQNNLILLAVSDGERVTESSSFLYYAFNSSLFPYSQNALYAPFLDFPRLGVDKNSVVIGGNQFGYDSLTNVGYVIDKKQLIHGNLVVYPFELGVVDFINGIIKGMYTPQGVYNDDPAAKKSFFAGISYYQDALIVASLEYDKAGKPRLTSETTVPVEPFNNPRDNSSPGGLAPIEQNDTRLLAAAIHKNKLTGKTSLWTAHAIGVNQSGHFIGGTDSDFVRQARTASRWYEIGNIYVKPTLSQIGTLHDADQPSGRRAIQYFNPSIAASGQGHAVLGGTTDAFNQYLNVFVAGRYNEDPAGALNKPVRPTNTTAIYAPYIDHGNGVHEYIYRWGEFSQTVVDPMEDQTIWTFQEYANVDDSYGVRAVQLKAPPPATPSSIGPFSNKSDAIVTLNGKSVSNSGFFDPGKDAGGPGYNRLSIKSTGNIIVSDVVFVSPTKLTFKLNTKNKPNGTYTLIITNPDGQFVLVNYVITNKGKKADENGSNKKLQDFLVTREAKKYITATSIFPNPAKDNVTIQINAVKEQKIKIVLADLSGKVVFEQSYNLVKGNSNAVLPLTNLSKGTYFAAIYGAQNLLVGTQKIIKQ